MEEGKILLPESYPMVEWSPGNQTVYLDKNMSHNMIIKLKSAMNKTQKLYMMNMPRKY